MATQEQILFSAPGGPSGRLRTRVLLSRYLQVAIVCNSTRFLFRSYESAAARRAAQGCVIVCDCVCVSVASYARPRQI